MGTVNLILLTGASLALAAAVTASCRGGRRAAPAVVAGLVVLALALLNVYQFAAGLAAPDEGNTQRRPRPAQGVAQTRSAPRASTTAPVLSDPSEQEVVDRFHRLFYAAEGTWQERTWLGIPTYQNPNDAWVHQEIIYEVKPDYIIEAGTAVGGSAILWATVLREVNRDGRVITMDIGDPSAGATGHPIWRERVEFIKGSSTDPATVARLADRVRGKRVLVILDSDHRKPHVLDELRAYAPMVNVGSYVIVQDTNVNGHPAAPDFGPGPMEALDEFLASNDQFEVDRGREALLLTLHPRGYLKRVR
jgi:cephalosporin hydroxylase